MAKKKATESAVEKQPDPIIPPTEKAESAQSLPAQSPPVPENMTTPPSIPPQAIPPTQLELLEAIMASLGPSGTTADHSKRDDIILKYLKAEIDKHPLASNYNILMLHDEWRIVKTDADSIYSALLNFADKSKPILLVVYSNGGSIATAYLIGKLCKEHAGNKFVVVVPREAKSAATLICCAADEIHMGGLSELGPIDPQIDDLPVLGLKSSVEHLAELVRQFPAASEMFAKYMHLSIKPVYIGYYERVAESALQYAERLLNLHTGNLGATANKIASDLVYTFKDHGFVIDKGEAATIFGTTIVKTNTPEYNLGNSIYQTLSLVARYAGIFNHGFYFLGSTESKPQFFKKK